MGPHVDVQTAALGETGSTDVARVRLLACVDSVMSLNLVSVLEGFPTDVTLDGLFARFWVTLTL